MSAPEFPGALGSLLISSRREDIVQAAPESHLTSVTQTHSEPPTRQRREETAFSNIYKRRKRPLKTLRC
ncbi:hypothetical protein JZ751_024249 [Albula glossodonta]|uniref:Uncharacterized protein n=1 Tax=Albula glossodonta TaxID=121402 RepID=A0A8T2NN60_9TELE|nr:hypothetical protein JZ751_024249 [Albula glossodonta]